MARIDHCPLSFEGYAEIDAEFLADIAAYPGMDPALPVEEALPIAQRLATALPGSDVGPQLVAYVESALAAANGQ